MSEGTPLEEWVAIFVILAMVLLMMLAVAVPLGCVLGIFGVHVFDVYPKVMWLFLWVVAGFFVGYAVIRVLT